MTPEQLARDAVRVVDRVERDTLRRILELLASVERDARSTLSTLELREAGLGRTIRELRAREAIRQSAAARTLLSMGTASGPIIDEFRRGVAEVSRDATRAAVTAATAGGFLDAAETARVLAFGTRVEPELLESFVRQTLTRLERVSGDGLRRIEDAVARGAIRGAGPRATARLVRDSVDLTRSESERIVRTVFMRANNEVRDASFRDMGVEYVQHNAANDERTCSYCEARHGMVYPIRDAPDATLHPNCRCVHTPWREDMTVRGDAYYERTRAEMRERREEEGRSGTTATARAPFERMDDRDPPRPVWAPGRGWL